LNKLIQKLTQTLRFLRLKDMIKIIITWILSFLSIKLLSFLVPQITVGDFLPFGIFLLVFALINFFIKPVLQFFTWSISFLTLGLFSLVINFFCLWLAIDATKVININTTGLFWFFSMILISVALSWSNQLQDNWEGKGNQ
jgi:putative membrane protein